MPAMSFGTKADAALKATYAGPIMDEMMRPSPLMRFSSADIPPGQVYGTAPVYIGGRPQRVVHEGPRSWTVPINPTKQQNQMMKALRRAARRDVGLPAKVSYRERHRRSVRNRD